MANDGTGSVPDVPMSYDAEPKHNRYQYRSSPTTTKRKANNNERDNEKALSFPNETTRFSSYKAAIPVKELEEGEIRTGENCDKDLAGKHGRRGSVKVGMADSSLRYTTNRVLPQSHTLATKDHVYQSSAAYPLYGRPEQSSLLCSPKQKNRRNCEDSPTTNCETKENAHVSGKQRKTTPLKKARGAAEPQSPRQSLWIKARKRSPKPYPSPYSHRSVKNPAWNDVSGVFKPLQAKRSLPTGTPDRGMCGDENPTLRKQPVVHIPKQTTTIADQKAAEFKGELVPLVKSMEHKDRGPGHRVVPSKKRKHIVLNTERPNRRDVVSGSLPLKKRPLRASAMRPLVGKRKIVWTGNSL